ncbi:NAD(P)H-hydrate dehydratase [Ruminococcus sp. Marseille-P6503]|uniref:NAD(P)H-hydrate dehydratase n=1 Tax=Ruminococcus sp. Marseille-P6503 TaxID=2364796 RepID=UPI000F527390|nr:NAD(P)H-hydrate dehydratase [Ruminococcus sp. Marseille-P6503]
MHKILTPAQMREAEQASVRLGKGLDELMDNSGERLARRIASVSRRLMKRSAVILAGSGNNGGDGFKAAAYLEQQGILPVVVLCCGAPATELSRAAFEGMPEKTAVLDINDERVGGIISCAGIIADCVFGTGFHGELSEKLGRLFSRINELSAFRIACDIPSGVNSLNGQVSAGAFRADETVTFHRKKTGMFFSPAKEYCGKIITADIGIPDGWDDGLTPEISSVTAFEAAELLPGRSDNSHKGTYGRCMLLCGSGKYPGAAVISSMSAMRSGVGLVELCTPESAVLPAVTRTPEITFTALNTDGEGFVSADSLPVILESLSKADSAVIGCGLGKTEDTERIVCEIVRNARCPLIIDADGINCLSGHIDVLKEKQTEIILTPHIGELARLCGAEIAEVLTDVIGYAGRIAERYGAVVHAKNVQTVTVCGGRCFITDFGCSALAKGGSGDMLAGLIGSLCAQGTSAADACILADYIMGRSAKLLCETNSPRGVLAEDIISCFPKMLWQAERGVIV